MSLTRGQESPDKLKLKTGKDLVILTDEAANL